MWSGTVEKAAENQIKSKRTDIDRASLSAFACCAGCCCCCSFLSPHLLPLLLNGRERELALDQRMILPDFALGYILIDGVCMCVPSLSQAPSRLTRTQPWQVHASPSSQTYHVAFAVTVSVERQVERVQRGRRQMIHFLQTRTRERILRALHSNHTGSKCAIDLHCLTLADSLALGVTQRTLGKEKEKEREPYT